MTLSFKMIDGKEKKMTTGMFIYLQLHGFKLGFSFAATLLLVDKAQSVSSTDRCDKKKADH